MQSSSNRFKENVDSANLGPGEYEGSVVGHKSNHSHASSVASLSKPHRNRRKTLSSVPQPAVLESEADRTRRRLRSALAAVEDGRKEVEMFKAVVEEKEEALAEKDEQLLQARALYLADKCRQKFAFEAEQARACLLQAQLEELTVDVEMARFERDSLLVEIEDNTERPNDTDELLLSCGLELQSQIEQVEETARAAACRRRFAEVVRDFEWISIIKDVAFMLGEIGDHQKQECAASGGHSNATSTQEKKCDSWRKLGQELKEKAETVRIGFQDLTRQYSSQKEDVTALKLEIQRLKEQLTLAEREIELKNETLLGLQESSVQDKKEYDAVIKVKEESIVKLEEDLTLWSADSASKSELIAKLQADLKAQSTASEHLEATISRLQEQHHSDIRNLESLHAEAVECAYDMECDNLDMLSLIDRVNKDLAEANNQCEMKDLSLKRTEEKLIKAETRAEEFSNEQAETEARLNLIEAERKELLAQLSQNAAQLESSRLELTNVRKGQCSLENEYAATKQKAAQLVTQNKELSSKNAKVTSLNESLRTSANAMKASMDSLKAESNRQKSAMEALKKTLAKTKADKAGTEERAKQSATRANKSESELRSIQQELSHLKSSRAAFEARLREEITNTSAKCDEWKSHCDKSKHRFYRLQSEYEKVKQAAIELEEANRNIEALHKRGSTLERTIGRLTEELTEVYEGGSFTCKDCEKRINAESKELVAKALKGTKFLNIYYPFERTTAKPPLLECVSEEAKRISEESARLAGHNNHKQKIRHLKKLKEENLSLKQQNIELQMENKRLRETNGVRAQRTPIRSRYS